MVTDINSNGAPARLPGFIFIISSYICQVCTSKHGAAGRAMHQSKGRLSANLEILIFHTSLYKGFQVARPACGFFEQGGARSGQTLAQRHYKR